MDGAVNLNSEIGIVVLLGWEAKRSESCVTQAKFNANAAQSSWTHDEQLLQHCVRYEEQPMLQKASYECDRSGDNVLVLRYLCVLFARLQQDQNAFSLSTSL